MTYYYEALDLYFQALKISKNVDSGCDYYLLASLYFGISDVYFNLGYFELSEYYLSICVEFLESGGDFIFPEGISKSSQGYLSILIGDYYKAIEYFNLSMGFNDDSNLLDYHMEWLSAKSKCYAHLGKFDIAFEEINKIKNDIRKKFPGNDELYVYAFSNEVDSKLLAKDTVGLLNDLDSISIVNKNQHYKLNNILNYVNYYQLKGEVDSINSYVNLAIDHVLNNLTFNNYKIAETYFISSQVKFEQKANTDALEHILRAQSVLTQEQDVLPDKENHNSFNARLYLEVLLLKSKIEYELNDRDELVNTSKNILEFLDVFFDQRLGLAESKFFFLNKLKPQFEELIDDCIGLEEDELAFLISQKLHGNLLALEIMKNNASSNYDLPYGYVDYEKKLKNDINEREIKLSQLLEGSAVFDSLSNDLFQRRAEYKKLVKSIENSNPGYYALKYASPEVKSVADIQNKFLNKKNALIEYFIGNDRLNIFIITHNELTVIQKDIDDDFDNQVEIQNDHLKVLLNSQVSFEDYVTSTEYLYNVLLGDVFELLDPKIKQLYLIPDGVISYIPFGTLFEKCPHDAIEGRYKLLPFLAKEYDFYYHYSSALLNNEQDILSSQFVGFAPDFKAYEEKYKLDELTYNKGELELVNQIAKGDIKINSLASIDNVKESLKNKGILHLATHAESNDSLPQLSRIFLQNGPVHAYEISNTNSKLDLAVLSACETGDGVLRDGEGLMSLARSFISSGCETIITSLWSVNDRNSVTLIHSFYLHLYDGKSIGDSLSKAKRDYLENTKTDLQAHPFNWATFICIGNPNQSFPKFPWSKVLLAMSLFCVSMFLWKKNRIITVIA